MERDLIVIIIIIIKGFETEKNNEGEKKKFDSLKFFKSD